MKPSATLRGPGKARILIYDQKNGNYHLAALDKEGKKVGKPRFNIKYDVVSQLISKLKSQLDISDKELSKWNKLIAPPPRQTF